MVKSRFATNQPDAHGTDEASQTEHVDRNNKPVGEKERVVGYTRDDLRALHTQLHHECELRREEANEAARAYRAVSVRRNTAHNRFQNVIAKRALVRNLLYELGDNVDYKTDGSRNPPRYVERVRGDDDEVDA